MKRKFLIGLVIGFLMFGFVGLANASSIAVDYNVTGSPGDYLLNFTVTNNIPLSYAQNVYFFGVDTPDDPLQGSPSGWQDGGGTWNNSSLGGSSIDYYSTWITSNYTTDGVQSGESLSGFTLHVANIPSTIHFYAFAYLGSGYYGDDAFNKGFNPGFEGVVGASDIGPVPEPSTMLLLGFGVLGLAGVARKKKK
jgi:hypothetical protein